MSTINCGIGARSQPIFHFRTNLCLPNCCTLRRSVQRGSILKSEAHKGHQPRKKFNSNLNSNMNSEMDDETKAKMKEDVMWFLQRVESTIEDNPAITNLGRSNFEPKKQPSKLTPGDIRSSKPVSNFDNLIRDHDDGIYSSSEPDFKLSRPASKFVRRSPIPISKSTQEAPKTNPIVREEAPKTIPIVREEAPKTNPIVREETLKTIPIVREEAPKTGPIDREQATKTIHVEEPQQIIDRGEEPSEVEKPEQSDQLPGVDFEKMTVIQLIEIAKARKIRGYSRFNKAQLVKALKSSQS